jgi:polyhydroxyalkanoate synthase
MTAAPKATTTAPNAARELPSDESPDSLQGALAGPLSPLTLGPAVVDLAAHIATAPNYVVEMAEEAVEQGLKSLDPQSGPVSERDDHRFVDPAWQIPPFSLFARNFQFIEHWFETCIMHAPGVSDHDAKLAAFAARQWLDAFSPSNLPWTNPEVLRATAQQGGLNFARGFDHLARDIRRQLDHGAVAEVGKFMVGRDVAITPGQVVFRNELMELIQYAPATPQTRPEPLLITPAWIMKYYILDLAPHHSFIRYLVERGYTVFCMSWRNPGKEMAETSFDDYRRLGPMAALDVISAICGGVRVHTLGYCLGGTLLSVAVSAMARDHDDRVASFGLLAAQTDFSEPGELQIFIDETQLDVLDGIMARQGYLDARQMAGAFSMLHARDLVWSRMIKSYLLGETDHPNDLMAWNADATRMPYRMHSQYLRSLFLRNDLAEGRFEAAGGRVRLSDVTAPIFAVGTEEDHVSPWRSVFKIHRLNPGDVTFALVSGGHNGGIVSEPGHKNRSYAIGRRLGGQPAPTPEAFIAGAARYEGSWWPAYADWLDARSGPLKSPPPMGAAQFRPLCPAPGTYVRAP